VDALGIRKKKELKDLGYADIDANENHEPVK
jgi:hypothetical protein